MCRSHLDRPEVATGGAFAAPPLRAGVSISPRSTRGCYSPYYIQWELFGFQPALRAPTVSPPVRSRRIRHAAGISLSIRTVIIRERLPIHRRHRTAREPQHVLARSHVLIFEHLALRAEQADVRAGVADEPRTARPVVPCGVRAWEQRVAAPVLLDTPLRVLAKLPRARNPGRPPL